ncbi:MAG TPA: hypothetical protein VD883_01615 [Candidatus Omnitrophota bacterium]|nr:hypothetical protein [Candidatus Omnitrophota bacterium]
MRRALFSILALGILILQPPALRAEESGTLLKGGVSMDASLDADTQSMLDAEDSRHEGRIKALDSKEQGLKDAHESEMEAIDEQDNLKGDAKARAKEEKTKSHERKMKDLERERGIEERVHKKRVGEIMAKSTRLLSDAGSAAGSAAKPPTDQWSDESIPGRMMKLAGEMDKVATELENNAMTAGNKFFKAMSKSVSRGAEFLAQDPEVPLGQMIDGIVTYLNNDQKENEEMLYGSAAKAVEDMQNDPATFFGEHAVDIALSGAGAAAEIAGARAVGTAGELGAASKIGQTGRSLPPPRRPTPPIERKQQAQRLEKAGQTLKGMAENAQKFSTFNLKAGSAAPDYAKIFPNVKGEQGPVNFIKSIDKNAGNNNCFPNALAAAKRHATGKPYIALDHNPHMPIKDPATGKVSYGDVATDPEVLCNVLKENFGKGKAKDPHYGGLEGLKAHQEGWPVEMKGLKSSKEREIRTSMGFGKEDMQGLVFVDGGEGTPGHVFNVWRNGNKVEFWDLQPDPPVQILSFSETEVVMQCGIWKETAAVDWKRVFFYRLE